MVELCFERIKTDSDFRSIINEASTMRSETQQKLNTAHLLLAIFTHPNPARNLLLKQGIDENILLNHMNHQAREKANAIQRLSQFIEENCLRSSVEKANTLHLLLALLHIEDSLACYLLSTANLDLDALSHLVQSALMAKISSNSTRSNKNFDEQLHITMLPQKIGSPFDLDSRRFPWLTLLGRNLTAMAYNRQLDCAIGREHEISQIIDTLGKRRANNPCLVGDPGVGKTAIVEGLAIKMAQRDSQAAALGGKALIELDMGSIMAGTSMRGSLSERMQGLKRDMEEAHGRVVVFIDEIHTLMKMGGGDDLGSDAVDGLKSVLARGMFPCIGSTTADEYQKYIQADPALERRFVKINVGEPSEAESIKMVAGIAPTYARHHGVKIKQNAIVACVQLADRFIHERKLPGKALDLLDFTLSRAKRENISEIGRREVAKCCSDLSNIPQEHLLLEPGERLVQLDSYLRKKIYGQDHTIARIAQVIRQGFTGFFSSQPTSMLLAGSTGVGKTQIGLELVYFLYGSRKNFIQLDMGDYSEPHSVSRLLGSPPGYVGHEEGGYLTKFLQDTPHSVLLIENIDRAHPEVANVIVQLLKSGSLCDSKGTIVSGKNTIVVLTCQLPVNLFSDRRPVLGFHQFSTASGPNEDKLLSHLKKMLTEEMWRHILEKIILAPLTSEGLLKICGAAVEQTVETVKKTRNIELLVSEKVLQIIANRADIHGEEGAWPIGSVVRKMIEMPIAEALVEGKLKNNMKAQLILDEGEIRVTALKNLSE